MNYKLIYEISKSVKIRIRLYILLDRINLNNKKKVR